MPAFRRGAQPVREISTAAHHRFRAAGMADAIFPGCAIIDAQEAVMADFLWGLWNGISAWPLLIVHTFGGWTRYPIYDAARDGGWYQFGFLLGAGSPIFGLFGRGKRKSN
jgi:hypothetical protein